MIEKKDLAFVFPGQGSQKVGMLKEMADRFAVVAETFKEASDVLGYDLWSLVQEGPQDKLNLTEITQPALLTSSVALWRVWCEVDGFQPGWMAGHSLGEWSALVCADVLDFSTAVALVRARGKYMQEAVPAGVGSMAAIIGLHDTEVEEACAKVSAEEIVSPVNYNSPGQVVVAGHANAVTAVMHACKEMGAKRTVQLQVSAPFHSTLMQPAAERLAQEINGTEFKQPRIPIVHNVTAKPATDIEQIKRLVIDQVFSPVRWVECVEYLVDHGVSYTLECGPGRVLCGLNKRTHKNLQTLHVETPETLDASITDLQ